MEGCEEGQTHLCGRPQLFPFYMGPFTVSLASHHSDRLPGILESPCLPYHFTEWN